MAASSNRNFAIDELGLETLIQTERIYSDNIGMEFVIENEKWATKNDGRNRTTKPRKKQNARRKGKLLLLGNIRSGHNQTIGEERKN